MKEKRTLTTGEVASYCGVNFRTVIRWIQRGQLKAYQLPGRGDNRIEVHNFLAFLRENNIPVPRDFQHLTRRVLIVEDDESVARTIKTVLEGSGLEVHVARDGFQAGSMLKEYLPSVMTLDLLMPGISGLEVIHFVRMSPDLAATKILVVSALPEIKLKEALAAGADDVLGKPFENGELAAKVLHLAKVEAQA
ncbi:MAG: response regulator [Planctomycetota bacterium]